MRKAILTLIAALMHCAPALAAQSTVCLNPEVEGFQKSHKNGSAIIGLYTTESREKIKIYIEKTANGYFYQSNFCKVPCSSKFYPVKIASDSPIDLRNTLENMIFTAENRLSPEEWTDESSRLLNDHVQIFLDRSAIGSDGRPVIDLSGASKIQLVDGERHITLASQVTNLPVSDDSSILTSRIAGCCLDGFPPLEAQKLRVALSSASVTKSNLKFASLVGDTATTKEIKGSSTIAGIKAGTIPIESLAALKQLIADSKGSTLMLLGHVEGSSFVVRDGTNKIKYAVGLSELTTLAKDSSTNVIFLGCNTAKQIEIDSLGAGVAIKFNTVELVKRLDSAVPTSKDFLELLENLSSEGLKIVVTENFANRLTADVYAKVTDENFWVKVAKLIFAKNS